MVTNALKKIALKASHQSTNLTLISSSICKATPLHFVKFLKHESNTSTNGAPFRNYKNSFYKEHFQSLLIKLTQCKIAEIRMKNILIVYVLYSSINNIHFKLHPQYKHKTFIFFSFIYCSIHNIFDCNFVIWNGASIYDYVCLSL